MRLIVFLTVLAVSIAPSFAQSPPPELTMDWEAIAERIVEQLDLQPGERVVALAHPGTFEEVIPHFRYAVMKSGAIDLGVVDVLKQPVSAGWNRDILSRALRPARAAYRDMFRDVDASVMLPGAVPSQPAYAAIQDLLREGRGRTIHFHWLENGSPFAVPGQPLPRRHVMEATYQKALLEVDYQALGESQERFEEAMRSGEVRVTSPLGTDLRFRIGDRPVCLQNGDASPERASRAVILIDREIELPAGAVRVAPLEETVEGTIAFPPSQWDGRPVGGLKLRFEKGRVIDVRADSGRDAVEAEMSEAGDAGRAFREFALGFNPELAVPERSPWIPYYGYGAGVVRLSLGDNTELGGNVSGGYVRWSFFTDTTVSVGGEVWVRGGRLVQ
jgi:hypothetical protein